MLITCCICCEPLFNNTDVVTTRCGHVFHLSCLNSWLTSKNSCPYCRAYTTADSVIQLFFNNDQTNNDRCKELAEEVQIKTFIIQDLEKELEEYAAKCENSFRYEQELYKKLDESRRMCDKEKRTNQNLIEKLDRLQRIEKVVSGTMKDVEDVLKECGVTRSASTLSKVGTFCLALKRQLRITQDQLCRLQRLNLKRERVDGVKPKHVGQLITAGTNRLTL